MRKIFTMGGSLCESTPWLTVSHCAALSGLAVQTPSDVLRELVSISRSGQHSGAAYMPGGSVLQLLAQQQQHVQQQ